MDANSSRRSLSYRDTFASALLRVFATCVITVLTSHGVWAQADFEKGYQAYQSYHGSDFDTVNLANGNLVLNIPLLTYEQRGGLPPVVVAIRGNSTTFQSDPSYSSGPADTKQYEVPSGVIGSPWGQPHVTISPGGLYWKEERITLEKEAQLSRFVAIDDSGATHSLGQNIANSIAPYIGNIRYSVDGSDLMLTAAASPLIVDRKGNVGGLVDRKGNAITLYGPCAQPPGAGQFYNAALAPWEGYAYGTASATSIVDSVGRTIPNPSYVPPIAQYSCIVDTDTSYYPAKPQANPSCLANEVGETYEFPGQLSGTVALTFCYRKIEVQATLPTASHSTITVNETWPVLTAAVLPNGTEWRFTYDLFGQVLSVTMPTGATVTYTYNKGYTVGTQATRLACGNPPGEVPVSGTPVWPFRNLMSSRMVTGRSLTVTNPDGTNSTQKWSYASTIGSGWQGSSNSGTVTVTDPSVNDTVHTYSLNFLGQPSYGQPVCGPYETATQYYQGSTTGGPPRVLIKSVATAYTYTGVDHANPTNFSNYIAIGVLPKTVTTTLYFGASGSQVSQNTYTYDSAGTPFGTYQDYKGTTYPFSFGLKTAETESDWGSGSYGSVLRTTTHSNYWQSNWSYYAVNLIDLPSVSTVFNQQGAQASQTTYLYDQSPSPSGALGNLTSVTRWLNTGTSPVSKTTYTKYGMPQYKYDPLGNKTQIVYDATNLYPKEIIYPTTGSVSHAEYFSYDLNTGELLSHTDQNGNPTTFTYDSMRRPLATTYPTGGGSETFTYDDAIPPSYVFTKVLNASSSTFTQTGLADTLGRKKQTQINSDPYGTVFVDTQYDGLGRVETQSNPYRSTDDPTYGLTTFTYDALGRKTIQQQPDGSLQQWCYMGQLMPPPYSQTNCNLQLAKAGGTASTGSWVDFQDESGNDWQRNSDGLGRLTSVMEPNGTQAAPPLMQTSYTYDALGDLLTVAQTGYGTDSPRASRSFTYDSLSRLLTALNPESGTTSYTYDLGNNLLSRTQPLVNATSGTENINYCYDALSRKTAEYTGSIVSNCSGPSQISAANLLAAYTYDTTTLGTSPNYPIDHLTAEIEYTSSTSVWQRSPYQYDTMGRLVVEQQCAFGSCTTPYSFAYTYDYAGDVTSTTNGLAATPITISYTYDNAARLSTVSSATPTTGIWAGTGFPSTLYTVQEYGPAGVTSAYYGSSSSTPMDLSRAYDNRLRIANNVVYSSSTPLPSAKVTLACVTSGCPSFSGSVSVTVGGVSTAFVAGSTLSAVASNLVTAINSTDGMNATATSAASGAKYVVTITSLIYGADGEASLSASVSSGATFTATASAAKLTGDKDTIAYQYSLGYASNNNVTSANDSINGDWTYLYDTLNRLVRGQATTAGVVTPSGTYKTQCWTYDSFGNRTGEGEVAAKTTCPSPLTKAARSAWTTYTTGNQVIQSTESGTTATYAFDDAGNVLNDGVNRYVYNLDGRICAVQNLKAGSAITQYVYDAEGRRVAKGTLTTWPAAGQACAAPTAANGFSLSGTGAALYLRGAKGDQDTETDGSGNWRHTNVFAGGGLTATYDTGSTATLSFNFADWLGSKRLQASSAGVTQNSWVSDPYGDYLVPLGTGADATEHHFTGKERDTESGNDYFGARYYSSDIGRFLAPDSLNIAALRKSDAHLFMTTISNPANWCGYQYGTDNPLSKTDLDGYLTIVVPGTHADYSKDWTDNSKFVKQVGKTFGEKPVIFKWSGKLSADARYEASIELKDFINKYNFKPGEKLNIVTHSHGGNVALESTTGFLSELKRPIDNLVTLGIPVMKDETKDDPSLVKNWVSVWTPHDGIVPLGSDVDFPNSAYQPDGAKNVEADEAKGHSDLWQNPSVWNNEVVPYLNLSGSGASQNTPQN